MRDIYGTTRITPVANTLRIQPINSLLLYAFEQMVYDIIWIFPWGLLYLLACLVTHRWDPHKALFGALKEWIIKLLPRPAAAKWAPPLLLFLLSTFLLMIASFFHNLIQIVLITFAITTFLIAAGTWTTILIEQVKDQEHKRVTSRDSVS